MQSSCLTLCLAKLRYGCQTHSGVTQLSSGPGCSILHLKYIMLASVGGTCICWLWLSLMSIKGYPVPVGEAAGDHHGQLV